MEAYFKEILKHILITTVTGFSGAFGTVCFIFLLLKEQASPVGLLFVFLVTYGITQQISVIVTKIAQFNPDEEKVYQYLKEKLE